MAKKAIVMGATSGIGMEVAKLLAAKGWQVGIAGRRIERLQALISQLQKDGRSELPEEELKDCRL